jgi:hypothetical protein
MIERLTTQRACIDFAIARIAHLPGPVLELGLGKGRTYDYLRRNLPGREIFAFDREVHAPADCIPDPAHLIVGDFRATLPRYGAATRTAAALVHADIGSEQPDRDARLAAELAPLLAQLLQPGALVLTDRAMDRVDWQRLPLPAAAGDWPYFIYCVPEADTR